MRRRQYLATVSFSVPVATAGCFSSRQKYENVFVTAANTTDTIEKDVKLIQDYSFNKDVEYEKAGIMTGTGKPIGLSGEFNSEMFWGENDLFDTENWLAAAPLGQSEYASGNNGAIWLNKSARALTDYTLVHERGHNLGYEHSDDGIMSYESTDSKLTDELSDVTRTIAKNTDDVIIFDKNTKNFYKEALNLWKNEYISSGDLEKVIEKEKSTETIVTKRITDNIKGSPLDNINTYTGGFYSDYNAGLLNSWR